MRSHSVRLIVSAFVGSLGLALSGCPEPVAVDAGAGAPDGGTISDAGGAAVDDAGVPVLDGGGAPGTDSGALGDDAGAVDDAGAPDGDAGSLIDGGTLVDGGAVDDGGVVPPPEDAGVVYDGPYWDSVDPSLNGAALVDALHAQLVSTHVELAYDDLFDAYVSTDGMVGGCAGIFDFYSDICWDPSDRCGQYNSEGDCYNREHSWPKSWWGGSESAPQYSDLFHVIPADGYVNNQRSNHPLGEVAVPTYTSGNGSLIGECAQAEAGGLCFEPVDALKGDFARIYFYMAVRYEGELGCCDRAAVNGADIKPWEEALLREWHVLDPVDAQERARNEAVFFLQGTRNPFVDDPSRVARIDDF